MRNRNRVSVIIITIILLCFSHIIVFGADNLYRLMHNDQQGLIIGQIIEIKEGFISTNINKQIISEEDMNSPNIEQIPLEEVINIETVKNYSLFYGKKDPESKPQKGDYILASINRSGKDFQSAWGIYKLDSEDYKTLNVLSPKNDYGAKMEAVAIKTFINSDGVANEFSFDRSKLYYDGKLIYDSAQDMSFIESDKGKEEANDISKKETAKGNVIFDGHESSLVLVLCLMIVIGGVSYFKRKKK